MKISDARKLLQMARSKANGGYSDVLSEFEKQLQGKQESVELDKSLDKLIETIRNIALPKTNTLPTNQGTTTRPTNTTNTKTTTPTNQGNTTTRPTNTTNTNTNTNTNTKTKTKTKTNTTTRPLNTGNIITSKTSTPVNQKIVGKIGNHPRNKVNSKQETKTENQGILKKSNNVKPTEQTTKGNEKTSQELSSDENDLVSKFRKSYGRAADVLLRTLTKLNQDPKKNQGAKELLLRDLRGGPLSLPHQSQAFKDAVPGIVALYSQHPELASNALDLAQTTKHPEVLAKGVKLLGALREARAKTKLPPLGEICEHNALKLGGMLGGDVFDRMKQYYDKGSDTRKLNLIVDVKQTEERRKEILGRLLKPEEKFVQVNATLRKEAADAVVYITQGRGNKLATSLATSLIDDKGNLTISDEFKGQRDDMHFHPSMLQLPQFSLITNVEDMMRVLSNEKTAEPYKKVLKNLTAVKGGSGTKLVARTLGKTGEITPTDGKRALMSGMLMPLFQGKVGSCFATAPSINQRKNNPVGVMQDMSDIITTGTLTKGKTRMPAVTSILEGENPILRSWEYTVASLGSRREGSNKHRQLQSTLFGIGGLSELMPFTLSGLCKSGEGVTLKKAMTQSFGFTFESNRALGQTAGDGNSDKGMWVMSHREKVNGSVKEETVQSWEQFLPKLKQLTKKHLPGRDSEIEKHLNNPQFIRGISQEFMSKPWIPGGSGGRSEETASLFTSRPLSSHKVDLLSVTVENRPTELLAKITQALAGKTQNSPLIDTPNHSVNVVPGQIEMLVGKNEEETKKNISQRLGQPGKKMAEAKLDSPRVSYLFEKFAKKYAHALKGKQSPTGELTPSEFKKHVQSGTNLSDDTVESFLLNELRPPETVLFDTNWGSTEQHIYWVFAPAPTTGVLTMWKKTEPDNFYEKETRQLQGNWEVKV